MSELGRSIKATVDFLDGVHSDIFTLIKALDGEMAERNWFPHSPKVTSGLGSRLESETWQIHFVTRIYIHQREATSTRRVTAVEIILSPSGYDEPICFGFAAHYETSRAPKDVWNTWTDNEAALIHLIGLEGPQELPMTVTEGTFMPGATRVDAFVVPLCNIASNEAVASLLANPLLELAET